MLPEPSSIVALKNICPVFSVGLPPVHVKTILVLSAEPPSVKVSRKVSYDSLETLTCRAHGFYPKQINATWRKDGKPWEQETSSGGVVPNSDGTYYTWISVQIEPKDRDHYQCHVEHAGLMEPLDLAWQGPGERLGGWRRLAHA